jgi:hypothetical protein
LIRKAVLTNWRCATIDASKCATLLLVRRAARRTAVQQNKTLVKNNQHYLLSWGKEHPIKDDTRVDDHDELSCNYIIIECVWRQAKQSLLIDYSYKTKNSYP